MNKSVIRVVCLRDCGSMCGVFHKGVEYSCEVLDVNYKEKLRIGFRSRKDFIHYIIDNNGEILTLDREFDDYFMELCEYRRLKLERLESPVSANDKNILN